MFVSAGARTFEPPPDTWKPGAAQDLHSAYRGSPQSLIGRSRTRRVTGVAGYVGEPFLDGTIRPDILFPAYVGGLNLIEAYYAAMPYLSWQTVVVGDPLCAPFRLKDIAAGADSPRSGK